MLHMRMCLTCAVCAHNLAGVTARSPKKKIFRSARQEGPTVFLQVKVSRRAGDLLRKRAKRALRSQASYLRALIYRDLGILDKDE